MHIVPFSTSHDAADPVGYTIEAQGYKFGIATDLGTYSQYTLDHLKNSDILLLEANHDVSMLEVGTYPYPLKRRILSDKGHLSNVVSGKLLCSLFHENMRHIILAHLSKEHNYPELAYQTVKGQLETEFGLLRDGFNITVAKRDIPSPLVNA